MAESSTDADSGATALLEQVETGGRHPGPLLARFFYALALAWSLFQVWIASPLPFIFNFAIFTDTQSRSIHLTFAMILAFAAYPAVLDAGRRKPGLVAWLYLVVTVVALVYAGALQLGLAAGTNPVVMLAIGITFGLVAWSTLFPVPASRIPVTDWLLMLAAAFSALYLYVFYNELALRPGRPILMDLVVAGVGMVTLLEATRRTLGPALTVIAAVFLLYTFAGPYMPDLIAHRGASLSRAASQFWLTAEGVFGIALGVSTSFVFLFVLFGALLDRAGAGNYFIQVAFSLLGHLRGGPAKAAVVASGLTGVISGSSIANTVTTGTFTIPLMKRVGFSSEKAGAVEVASSVNGQLMPPVMGAAAFLMVEYVGIPYVEVIKHALLPAVISYIALLYIVHLEAVKAGMQGIPPKVQTPLARKLLTMAFSVLSIVVLSGVVYYGIGWMRPVFGDAANIIIAVLVLASYLGLLWNASRFPELALDHGGEAPTELPAPGPTINSGLHFILPIVVLVWALIVERLSPGLSAFWAVAFLIFILLTQRPIMSFFRGRHRYAEAALEGVRDLLDGLVGGARNMVGIGVATAAAGIIVGTVSMTGIGLVLTQVVETLSGGNLFVMLVLVAVMSLVLGLGLPTTANYIIVATLMAPIVVQLGADAGLIVPLIAVHLFVFYFGIMADVTPPVGLASFAAAAVSRGDPIMTGVHAFWYSMRTVALPFIFIFNTQLLLIGITSWWDLSLVIFSAVVAMLVFAAATQGWFLTRTRWYEVVGLLLVAFTLLRPGFWMDYIHPEYDRLAPDQLAEVVGETREGGHLRIWVEGMNADGRDISRVAMLPLGSGDSVAQRLTGAGLTVMEMGDRVQISNVGYGSTADRMGLEFGWDITGILVPADRPARQWFFIPALGLLGLIWWWQRRRVSGGAPAPGSRDRR
ncbi:MAG: TRAP transporter permease [Aquisalimonadaceae bacterium]